MSRRAKVDFYEANEAVAAAMGWDDDEEISRTFDKNGQRIKDPYKKVADAIADNKPFISRDQRKTDDSFIKYYESQKAAAKK